MPVTAKLSRNFYSKFGDEIADELVNWFNMIDSTYRADLRELNDRKFERFELWVNDRLLYLSTDVGHVAGVGQLLDVVEMKWVYARAQYYRQ